MGNTLTVLYVFILINILWTKYLNCFFFSFFKPLFRCLQKTLYNEEVTKTRQKHEHEIYEYKTEAQQKKQKVTAI